MTEAGFAYLRRFLKARSGLDLGPEKAYLAETRLQPICRQRGFTSLDDLLRELRASPDGELPRLVADAMANNETFFFRDRASFDALRDTVLPRLAGARRASRRLRVWSAACSTGQEAYSLAMLVADLPRLFAGWQVSILATDLSTAAIERARGGLYSQFEVQRGLPIRRLLQHFTQTDEGWRVSPTLRAAVEFRVLNLLEDFRDLGGFDLIVCRNLLIYLDGPTKADLVARLAGALTTDGTLCLGAAESAPGKETVLAPDPTAHGFYRPVPAAARPQPLRAAG